MGSGKEGGGRKGEGREARGEEVWRSGGASALPQTSKPQSGSVQIKRRRRLMWGEGAYPSTQYFAANKYPYPHNPKILHTHTRTLSFHYNRPV